MKYHMKRFHLGVDIVAVKRIEEAHKSHDDSFLSKFLTNREIEHLDRKSHKIASRWAAKEALYKAFSSAGITTSYKDFEIETTATGAPVVNHSFTDWEVAISLSHEKDHAIAFCQIQKIQL